MKRRTVLSLCAASLVMVGCASVFREEGVDKLPQSEIAVLETGVGTIEGNKVTITHIDGKKHGKGAFHRFELLPGEHTIEVILVADRTEPKILQLNAKRGVTYSLVHKIDTVARTWSVSIVEKDSWKIPSHTKAVRAGWLPGSLPAQKPVQ